jgi:hypothetical protein
MGTKCGERKIYKNRMDTKFGERKMYRNCMDTKCQERKIYRNCMDRKYKERKIYIHTSRRQRFTEEGEETTWIQHAGERKITHTLRRQRDRKLILLKSLIHSPSCCSFSKCDRKLTDYVVNPVYLQLLHSKQQQGKTAHTSCPCISIYQYISPSTSPSYDDFEDKRSQKMTDKNTPAKLHNGSSNEAARMGKKS